MSLKKRHIGRRVAGVGLGVTLIVLGLQAPAFAVTPTITSFLPGSGPPGCVVVITGTNFNNPTVSAVDFNGTPAANFSVVSATELWATVPAAAADGAIHVTNASGTANSPSNFDVTAGTPGGCAPTVTSFEPTCGLADATVVLTGTNLLAGSDPTVLAQQTR